MSNLSMPVMVLLGPPVLLAAMGVYLLAQVALSSALELGVALRWRLRSRAERLWHHLQEGDEQMEQDDAQKLPSSLWWGMGGGAALALLWHHPLLSPWFLVLGGAAGWLMGVSRSSMSREEMQTLETFISAFRSVFSVSQSIFTSLEAAVENLEEESGSLRGPGLRHVVEKAVRRYRTDADAEQALATLHEAGWPQLDRLAAMLSRVGQADSEVAEAVLERLEEQVRRSRELRDRAHTVLTLNRATLRVLQALNAAALAGVAVLGLWRDYYVARPLMLMAITAMAVGGSWYFSQEVSRIGRW